METDTYNMMEGEPQANLAFEEDYMQPSDSLYTWDHFAQQTGDEVPSRIDDNMDMQGWMHEHRVQGSPANEQQSRQMFNMFAATHANMSRIYQQQQMRGQRAEQPDYNGLQVPGETIPRVSNPTDVAFLLGATVMGGLVGVLIYAAVFKRPLA